MFKSYTPETPPFAGYRPTASPSTFPTYTGPTYRFSGTQALVENADDFSMYSLMGVGTYPNNLPILTNIANQPQWFGPGIFSALDYLKALDSFQQDTSGTISSLNGGDGWLTDGQFVRTDYVWPGDNFESYAIGTIATLNFNPIQSAGTGWAFDGTLFTYPDYPTNNDDFEIYLVGTVTTLDQGAGWSFNGTLFTYP